VPEGFSAAEVGKEIGEHAKHAGAHQGPGGPQRWIVITEAVLLSVVAITAAWSGYASAKWGTESSLQLAKASATRTKANRADLEAISLRTLDASTFNAWFTAHIARDKHGEALAIKRFRPTYRLAFDAWLATNPDTNPNAPPGPSYMPQYEQPQLALSRRLDLSADAYYEEGSKNAGTADDYVRTTIFLASVLFLVGISSHFPVLGARYALIGLGAVMLVIAFVLLLQLPGPPA
jgi:hypothetical protein